MVAPGLPAPVVAAPVPQSIAYVHGASFTPGSVKEPANAKSCPDEMMALPPTLTAGTAFRMVAVVDNVMRSP